jgi:hypothetical protein
MPYFRCFFMDGRDHILFPAEITADDLEGAKRHAFGVLEEKIDESNQPIEALEIWQGGRLLFRS